MHDLHEYPVTVHWTSDREGWAGSSSLPPIEVATAAEFGGPEGFWSPEHLFVGAVASCFMATFVAIARNSNLDLVALDVPATGLLDRGDDRRFRIREVRLRPHIVVARVEDRGRALRIVEKAHRGCLIAKAIHAEVLVEPLVEVEHAALAS